MNRKRMVWGGVLGAVALAGAGVLIASGSPAQADTVTDSQAMTYALRAATDSGEASPSNIQYVLAARGAANALLSGSTTSDNGSATVLVIQEFGHFTATHAHVPEGFAVPTGTVLSVLVDPSSGDVLDYGLTNSLVDLSPLGQVHQLVG